MKWLTNLFTGGETVMPLHLEKAEDLRSLVQAKDKPLLVYVHSETCAPCRKMEGEIVATTTKHQDTVRVAEVNASAAEPGLLAALGVRGTPTVLVFAGGREKGRVSGFRPRSWFDQMIETEFS